MSNPIITIGTRAFFTDIEEFGEVTRVNLLGLPNAPVMRMDDNGLHGACGYRARERVVRTSDKKNELDETVPIPLDVRMVGIAQLTAAGIPAPLQGVMFENWRTKLTPGQRLDYTAQWENTAANGNPEQIAAFIRQMVTLLS